MRPGDGRGRPPRSRGEVVTSVSTSHTHVAPGPRLATTHTHGRANLQDKAPKRDTTALPGTHVGWVPYHGAIARACRTYLRTDTRGHVIDSDLANLTAIFIAGCYRWRGKSTRAQGGWFSKTDAQWCDEIGIHKERLWDILRFACIDDATATALGVPNIGIIRRRTGGRHNAAAYLVDDTRAGAWWLTSGPQPALQAVDNVGMTPLMTPASCQASLTSGCQASLTHQTNSLFGGVGKKEEDAQTAVLTRDAIERQLAEVFGDRWIRAIDKNVPLRPDTPARQMIHAGLRKSLVETLDGELRDYLRGEWAIADEGVLWELGAACAHLGFTAAWVRREVGDPTHADNRGKTMRNPTGVFVHRLRARFAQMFAVALRTTEAGAFAS